MFDIRFSTPAVTSEDGILQAGAQLRLGNDTFIFTIDLRHWSIADYEGQWREGIWRILEGAPTSALMTAYAGPDGHVHHMWALWREANRLYVQQHAVTISDLEHPFVPLNPYAYVGARIEASKYELPIPEWRVELSDILAAAKKI
jgi:CdiI N-terminal domain